MPTKQWQRVQELYQEALARQPGERASFLTGVNLPLAGGMVMV